MPGSFEAERPARLVMPKAVNLACVARFSREERGVERVGAGIAALDVVDAELVEQRRDGALVLEREVDAGRLRAVAQRRVEEIEPFAAVMTALSLSLARKRLVHGGVGEPLAADGHGVPALRLEPALLEERPRPCR